MADRRRRSTDLPVHASLTHFLGHADVGGGNLITARTEYANVLASLIADVSGSPWSNTELVVAGSYTVTTDDIGKTIVLTTTVGTLTVPAASGFPAASAFVVVNQSTRGWTIAPSGLSSFFLWPGKIACLFKINGVWHAEYDRIWVTPTTTTFHVNHSTGSSSNDGLTSGSALPTIQAAIAYVEKYIDCFQLGITVQVNSTSFTENAVVHTKRIRGWHVISLRGDPANPQNCVWNVGAGQVGFTCRDWSGAIISGFEMRGAGSGATGVSASQHGIIDVDNMRWGTFTGGIHVQSTNGGSVGYVVGTRENIVGDAALHWNVSAGANLLATGCTIGIPSPRTMTAFLSMTGGSTITAGVTLDNGSGGAAATVTGARYSVAMNGVYLKNGVNLPGSTEATSTGGQAA
jgi:hypothetical protein